MVVLRILLCGYGFRCYGSVGDIYEATELQSAAACLSAVIRATLHRSDDVPTGRGIQGRYRPVARSVCQQSSITTRRQTLNLRWTGHRCFQLS